MPVVFAEQQGDALQGAGVGDAVEDELGLEEGEESVGGVRAPAVAGLGEVLKAGEDVQALSAGFGDKGGEVVDGGDVGDLVDTRAWGSGGVGGGVVVGGGAELLEEADDERRGEGLLVRRGL